MIVVDDPARIKTCEQLANLVAEARESDLRLSMKAIDNPKYRGSIEEMDDLHDWFVQRHPAMVAKFCCWCHERRKTAIASPSGTDITAARPVVQYDVRQFQLRRRAF